MHDAPTGILEAPQDPTPPETLSPLQLRQRDREDECLARGVERFRRKLENAEKSGNLALVGAARSLLVKAVDPFAKVLHDLGETTGRGSRHQAVVWARKIGYEEAAFIVARTVLEHAAAKAMSRPRIPFTKLALEISSRILDEIRYARFQEAHPYLFEYQMKRYTSANFKHRRRSLNSVVGTVMDAKDLDLKQTTRLVIGAKLLTLFVETTGLVTAETTKSIHKKRIRAKLEIVVPPETIDWLKRKNSILQFLAPMYRPLALPPKPWAPQQRGGYWFALAQRFPLVKKSSPEHLRRLSRTSMPQVYTALNALQDTPWRINTDVLGILRQIRREQLATLGLYPGREDLPPKPVDMDTNDEARKAWRRRASEVKDENYRRKLACLEFDRTLYEADELTQLEQFFFAYQCDFRGRIYPICSFLSPQGADLGKSLLTFADPKPLGDEGINYLAVHGMNMLGDTPDGEKVSAMTIQQRMDWITAHSTQICAAAEDPFGEDWWTVADKPLQFYAFCCEWKRMIDWLTQGKRVAEFMSALPVAQDGSCNGVQHFAAMLRDVETGLAVNLVPRTIPQDLYTSISDQVSDIVEADAAGGNVLALLWLGSELLGRKLVKRPSMTFAYGSQKFGFAKQLQEYLKTHDEWRSRLKQHFTTPEGKSCVKPACQYLAGVIWDAIAVRAAAAAQAMAWKRRAAQKVLQLSKPVEWTVPGTGFQVRQEYYDVRYRQIKTVLNGKILKPSVAEQTDDLSKYKQRNALAPNFVHSLDAAILMQTVVAAQGEGVRHFGMVHDSYATVAGDMPKLALATRKTFVAFYETYDPLTLFWEQMKLLAPEQKIPEPPPKGELEIQGVLESAYFFA